MSRDQYRFLKMDFMFFSSTLTSILDAFQSENKNPHNFLIYYILNFDYLISPEVTWMFFMSHPSNKENFTNQFQQKRQGGLILVG